MGHSSKQNSNSSTPRSINSSVPRQNITEVRIREFSIDRFCNLVFYIRNKKKVLEESSESGEATSSSTETEEALQGKIHKSLVEDFHDSKLKNFKKKIKFHSHFQFHKLIFSFLFFGNTAAKKYVEFLNGEYASKSAMIACGKEGIDHYDKNCVGKVAVFWTNKKSGNVNGEDYFLLKTCKVLERGEVVGHKLIVHYAQKIDFRDSKALLSQLRGLFPNLKVVDILFIQDESRGEVGSEKQKLIALVRLREFFGKLSGIKAQDIWHVKQELKDGKLCDFPLFFLKQNSIQRFQFSIFLNV